MPEMTTPETFLSACAVDSAVFELRPDYRAMLLVIDGLTPDSCHETNNAVDALVAKAENHARSLLENGPVDELPHITSWREAYRAFGAKPQRTRNSLEALTRRAEKGLPRVNPLTDVYNAISVLHQIPLGGEDYHRYNGPARLIRAVGDEPFDTVANGSPVVEQPEPGEVVWCDDTGVTCRRWNWRQGSRTGLTQKTRTALFILDVLAPFTDAQLHAVSDALTEAFANLYGNVRVSKRLVTA